MKTLKKIALVLLIIFSVIGIAGFIISQTYEDEVKKYLIEQINQQVKTKIEVKNISFSVFKKFPNASIIFEEVTVEEYAPHKKSPGTLASLNEIYFQFNLLDLLKENYTVKKIEATSGMLNVQIFENGNDNYHIWKTIPDSTSKKINFELKNVALSDFTFYFLNELKDIDFSIETSETNFTGSFNESVFEMSIESSLYVHRINEGKDVLAKDKNVYLNTVLEINNETEIYTINDGTLKVENLGFNLSGDIKTANDKIILNIISNGDNLDILSIISLLPKNQRYIFDQYNSSGSITYKSIIAGEISRKVSPKFDAEFSVKNAEIQESNSGYTFKNLSFSGVITNGKKHSFATTKIAINNLSTDFGPGHISGAFELSNLSNPYIVLRSKSTLDLNDTKYFFKLDTLATASGKLLINVEYQGYIQELDSIQAQDLKKLKAKGSAQIVDANITIKNSPHQFNNINGKFEFKNNDIKIESLDLYANKSHVNLVGNFNNLLSFLFVKNEPLKIDAQLKSKKLILDELILSSASSADSTYNLSMSENIVFNFSAQIDTFYLRRFKAYDIQSSLIKKGKVINASNLSLKTMEGTLQGDVLLDTRDANAMELTINALLENIQIDQLFYQLENFGQTTVIDKNIKGIGTADVQVFAEMKNDLSLNKDKLYILADLMVDKGELKDCKPILALSKFIEVEDLQHIKFATLKTQVEVKNQVITVPQTEIISSALDLSFGGTHTFNNEIDYHFKVFLNDVLWKKAKRKKRENSEFGYVEDDGLRARLYIRMYGTIDDYKISYDTEGLKEQWKSDWQKEKNNIKSILKEELRLFKKDTSIQSTKEKDKNKSPMQIEWEEDNDTTKETNPIKKGTKVAGDKTRKASEETKKGIKKFFNKLSQPNEEEYEEDPK
ncbi:MAG: hypothetical protein Kow0079_06370 [Vicingaceae bacterium]